MAAAGAGIAFVDDLSARAHRPEGIVFRAIAKTARFPIYTVVNRNRPPSQLGKAFLELAREKLDALQRTPLTQRE
jgi:DNA-binding transcriptional LysR family regulator